MLKNTILIGLLTVSRPHRNAAAGNHIRSLAGVRVLKNGRVAVHYKMRYFSAVSNNIKIWSGSGARIDYLMVLRGMAVIGVLLGHAFGIGTHSVGVIVSKSSHGSYALHERFSFGYSLIEVLTPIIGRNFVILFFVLSGYLMGKVFFTGHHDAIKGKYEFYKARYLRLAPLLYFNLLVCAALFFNADLNPIKAIGDVLFITNFTGRGINLVTWSLSPEMQYYLVAPFIFLVFQRARPVDLIGAIALTAILFVLPIFWSFAAYFDVAFAFAAGFAVNLLLRFAHFRASPTIKVCSLLVGVASLHFCYNLLWFFSYFKLADLATVVIATITVAVCEAPEGGNPLRRAGILFFLLRVGMLTGFLTYGIYLWHYAIIVTRAPLFDAVVVRVGQKFSLSLWQMSALYHAIQIPIVIGLSFALSYITFVFIENRFRPNLYSDIRLNPVTTGHPLGIA
jgi:peptidoglycan/LPS O-acetylase OafA/YrhL